MVNTNKEKDTCVYCDASPKSEQCNKLWTCQGCKDQVPWCFGAADNKPELCTTCWNDWSRGVAEDTAAIHKTTEALLVAAALTRPETEDWECGSPLEKAIGKWVKAGCPDYVFEYKKLLKPAISLTEMGTCELCGAYDVCETCEGISPKKLTREQWTRLIEADLTLEQAHTVRVIIEG